jgi:class 3 adenylate cyclase
MEPQIQYAKTSDAVSIAYFTLGEGVPLVVMPAPFSDMESEWRLPDNRGVFVQRLADQLKVVRYDSRGTGSSQREVEDMSLLSHGLDLEAVVDQLGLETLVLFVPMGGIATAIDYAVRFPGKVSRLILWCTTVSSSDLLETPMLRGMMALLEHDWDLFTETMAQLVYGFSGGEEARRFAETIRESVSYDTAKAMIDTLSDYDVSELLPRVACPTLVMHRRDMVAPSPESARSIAASIPGARLGLVDGSSILPNIEDLDGVLRAIFEFLELQPPGVTKSADATEPGAFRTILFTDIEGSTALTDRLGDAASREVMREHERITREALKAHGGSEVKTLGDGFMASFGSTTKALECAIATQLAFAAHNESAKEPIRVRIGLNAGEPIAEDDPDGRGDLFGTAVNMAARIAAKAEGGEILVADVVRQLVAGKRFSFSDRGETDLRGFEDPVRLYEVRWEGG